MHKIEAWRRDSNEYDTLARIGSKPTTPQLPHHHPPRPPWTTNTTMPPKPNTRSTAIKRILQEVQEFERDPPHDFTAQPLEDDLFDWHITMKGAEGSDYEGGECTSSLSGGQPSALSPTWENGCIGCSRRRSPTWSTALAIASMLSFRVPARLRVFQPPRLSDHASCRISY